MKLNRNHRLIYFRFPLLNDTKKRHCEVQTNKSGKYCIKFLLFFTHSHFKQSCMLLYALGYCHVFICVQFSKQIMQLQIAINQICCMCNILLLLLFFFYFCFASLLSHVFMWCYVHNEVVWDIICHIMYNIHVEYL